MVEVADTQPVWARAWFWVLLALVSVVPFMASPLPMMPDYFSHMARYHVESHIGRSAYLARYYAYDWQLIGNLGVDLVMVPLTRLLPTELAGRMVAAAIPMLTIAGIYAAARAAWGRIEAPALLALPFVWSFSFVFGFVNYTLAMALSLLVFALWIRRPALPLAKHALLFAPLGLAVWIAHVAGWGALLVAVGGWQLATAWEQHRSVRPALLQTTLRMAPLLLPLVFIVAWRTGNTGDAPLFLYDWPSKLIWSFNVLKAENRIFDVACVGVIATSVLLIAVSRGTRWQGPMLGSALALTLAYCALPQMLFDSAFADTRILPVLAIVLLLSIAPGRPKQAQAVALLALVLFGARMAAITVGWHERGLAAEEDLRALQHVPQGSRIAVLAPPTYCTGWQMRGFEHLASIAIIRREAFVNTQWGTPGGQPMRPTYNERYGFNRGDSTYVSGSGDCGGRTVAQALRALPRDRFDYVWVFHAPMPRTSWLRPVFSGPDGRLYAIER